MTRRLFALISAVILAVVMSLTLEPHAQRASSATWITAWATSQNGLAMTPITHATVRMIARVTIPGDALRIRLDNTFGTNPVTIARGYVGHRIQGAALAVGSNHPLSFNGSAKVVIPVGASVVSEPVSLHVLAGQDLAVSLYVPDENVRPSQHGGAVVTSYVSASGSGDVAAEEGRTAFSTTTTSMFWLKAIDVLSLSATGAIVAFGDSITDGTCATLDANNRWEDWVAVRAQLEAESRGQAGVHKAIVNEGIGGNTVTRDVQPPPDSPSGMERLDRDVLSHVGTTHVVLFMGTNDIRRNASASQVIAGMQDVISRAKARGLKVIGVTIIPRHNAPPSGTNTGWDASKTQVRHVVNQWIRTNAPFDGVIDFDRTVRNPTNADLIDPPFNCGDGIHPSPRGYYEMGKSVRLDLFKENLKTSVLR
jgi:lysophospholipase L1-like esterase